MKSLLKSCGLAALMIGATGLFVADAEAGRRREACCCQSYNAAPATAVVGTTTEGHQRYQSAYQAPSYMPANNYVSGPTHYSSGIPLNFQERSFHDQWDAGRKIRGY